MARADRLGQQRISPWGGQIGTDHRPGCIRGRELLAHFLGELSQSGVRRNIRRPPPNHGVVAGASQPVPVGANRHADDRAGVAGEGVADGRRVFGVPPPHGVIRVGIGFLILVADAKTVRSCNLSRATTRLRRAGDTAWGPGRLAPGGAYDGAGAAW